MRVSTQIALNIDGRVVPSGTVIDVTSEEAAVLIGLDHAAETTEAPAPETTEAPAAETTEAPPAEESAELIPGAPKGK